MGKKKENPMITKNRVNEILMKKSIDYANYWNLCGQSDDNLEIAYEYLLTLLDKTEGRTNNYINKLLTGILSYIMLFNNNNYFINDEDKEKILQFEKKYLQYVSSQDSESSKDILETLGKLKKAIEENNNIINNYQNVNEKLIEKQREIDSLKDKLKGFEQSVNSLNALASEKDKLQNRFDKLKDKLDNLTKEYNIVKSQIEKSKNICESITCKSVKIDEQLLIIKEIIEKLELEISNLEKENEQIKKENIIYLKEINQKKSQDNRCREIDEYVLNLLFQNNGISLSDIISKVKSGLLDYSKLEIQQALYRIAKDYFITNINQYDKQFPVLYGIYHPMYTSNGSLTIPCSTDTLDLIITSDWHLSSDNDVTTVIEKLSRIYNYCIENNINYILNLGDLLDVRDDTVRNQFYTNMHLLERILKEFPCDDSICHAILFGNHDKKLMFQCGLNLPLYLESQRSDFISLGVDFSKIIIPISGNNPSNIIGLHHPRQNVIANKDLENGLPDNSRMSKILIHNQEFSNILKMQKEIVEYLNGVYAFRNLKREDSFMDFLGHLHSSQMYVSESICSVPSLMRSSGSSSKGLIHLSLAFDSDHKIEGAIVTSLIDGSKLKPISSTVYQKKKH